MSRVAIITGITGQDGSYLANLLLQKKYRVVGIAPNLTKKALWRLDYLGIHKRLTLVAGKLTDTKLLTQLLTRYHPRELYNLAGQSSVGQSWNHPNETFSVNATGVIQLLELIQRHSPKTRFFQASSAEIYGNSSKRITEATTAFAPLHPYGVSKLAAHLAVKNFRSQYGLFVVNGVMFNHESPLKDTFFVTKQIVQGVAKIACGQAKSLELGNLATKRDFGYAEDFVRAMWLMLQPSKPSDYILCTGKTRAISAFVAEAFKTVGIKNWQSYVRQNATRLRKNEVQNMRGSSAKIKRDLGWTPTVTFPQLVKKMVRYELKQLC